MYQNLIVKEQGRGKEKAYYFTAIGVEWIRAIFHLPCTLRNITLSFQCFVINLPSSVISDFKY